MKRDINLFINDIKESIKNIEEFSEGLNKEKFSKDKLRQSAIIRQLEIIGEAVKNLPKSFREKSPKISWRDIAGFRDILSHAYFGISMERVWNILKFDLPVLKKELTNVEKLD